MPRDGQPHPLDPFNGGRGGSSLSHRLFGLRAIIEIPAHLVSI
jgi:hypothetical protein